MDLKLVGNWPRGDFGGAEIKRKKGKGITFSAYVSGGDFIGLCCYSHNHVKMAETVLLAPGQKSIQTILFAAGFIHIYAGDQWIYIANSASLDLYGNRVSFTSEWVFG